MIITDVMAELGAKLQTITGLRVYPYTARSIKPPAASVALPDRVDYDLTYGRGSDSMMIKVLIVVGLASERAATLELAAYLDGADARSIKAALDGDGTAYDDLTVQGVEINVVTVNGTDYLSAEFDCKIIGAGR